MATLVPLTFEPVGCDVMLMQEGSGVGESLGFGEAVGVLVGWGDAVSVHVGLTVGVAVGELGFVLWVREMAAPG
jgi:hypothetical protein